VANSFQAITDFWQILATTYSRLYSKSTNKEISNMIDLSMEIDSMDRVTRPCANTSEQIKRCLSEINCKKIVLHISWTTDDTRVYFATNWTEERDLFRFVCNICSPGTDRKLKRIDLLWISGNNTTSLAKRLTKSRSKLWDVQSVIFDSGYIPKEEWEELAQTFYAYLYADSKRNVMRAYQSTLARNISENATMYLQLFQKNKDNEIVHPAQLRLAEMSTKKLSKKHKEENSLELDNRMMSVHAKLPELNDSAGQSNPERNSKNHSLMERSQKMTATERLLALMSRFMGVGRPLTPMIPLSSGANRLEKNCQRELKSSQKGLTDIFKIDTKTANT
jgi:hypothetical protein